MAVPRPHRAPVQKWPHSETLALRKAVEAADVTKHVTPHVFRHSYGTHASLATKDPLATVRLLRHSSMATTRRYIHYTRGLGEQVNQLPAIEHAPRLKVV